MFHKNINHWRKITFLLLMQNIPIPGAGWIIQKKAQKVLNTYNQMWSPSFLSGPKIRKA